MKKRYPTFFHSAAEHCETLFVSAGKLGAQIEAAPRALLALTGAKTADIIV